MFHTSWRAGNYWQLERRQRFHTYEPARASYAVPDRVHVSYIEEGSGGRGLVLPGAARGRRRGVSRRARRGERRGARRRARADFCCTPACPASSARVSRAGVGAPTRCPRSRCRCYQHRRPLAVAGNRARCRHPPTRPSRRTYPWAATWTDISPCQFRLPAALVAAGPGG